MTQNNQSYTSHDLSILVEEFITQQRSEFTLKGLYSYIVYWGMEDHRIFGDQLRAEDGTKLRNKADTAPGTFAGQARKRAFC